MPPALQGGKSYSLCCDLLQALAEFCLQSLCGCKDSHKGCYSYANYDNRNGFAQSVPHISSSFAL